MARSEGEAVRDEDDDYPVDVGDIVEGKYRVDRFIGLGAMGLVVDAWHIELKERVAIKFLRHSARNKQDAVARFSREARAAARLKSEHVAKVIDVGNLGTSDTPYIVMEYLEGANLEDVILRDGPFRDVSRATLYAIQICEALAEAHSFGIVHRDIKPANIFLAQNTAIPIAKLLDFGISKAAITGEYTNLSVDTAKTTAIMGSPYYMAPEQVRSTRDVDARADIWALGAVLFELITGQAIWHSEDLGKLVTEILSSKPRLIRELRPDVSPQFEAVLSRALEPDVEARYRTAAELAQALLPFAPASAHVHVERALAYKPAATSAGALPLLRQSSRDVAARPNRTTSSRISTSPEPRRISSTLIALIVAGAATVGILILVVPRLFASDAKPVSDSPAPSDTVAPPATTSAVSAAVATHLAEVPPPPPTSTPSETAKAEPPPVKSAVPAKQPWLAPPTRPVTPATASASAKRPAPSGQPTSSASIDSDPWKRNQPKLEDNPFK